MEKEMEMDMMDKKKKSKWKWMKQQMKYKHKHKHLHHDHLLENLHQDQDQETSGDTSTSSKKKRRKEHEEEGSILMEGEKRDGIAENTKKKKKKSQETSIYEHVTEGKDDYSEMNVKEVHSMIQNYENRVATIDENIRGLSREIDFINLALKSHALAIKNKVPEKLRQESLEKKYKEKYPGCDDWICYLYLSIDALLLHKKSQLLDGMKDLHAEKNSIDKKLSDIKYGQRKLSGNDAISKYLTSLFTAKLINETFIETSERNLLSKTKMNRLFKRQCFDQLTSILMESDHQHAILSGTEGYGTTTYGLYLVWKLINEGTKVLFSMAKGEMVKYFVLDPAKKIVVAAMENDAIVNDCIDDDKVIWIMDGKEHGYWFGARCLVRLICSTNPTNYRGLGKSAEQFYMPPWSYNADNPELSELITLKRTCFENVSDSLFHKLVEKWGPNPRHVLDNAHSRYYEKKLEAAINSCNASNTATTIWSTYTPDISHKLLITQVDESFQITGVDFASSYILQKITEKWEIA